VQALTRKVKTKYFTLVNGVLIIWAKNVQSYNFMILQKMPK